MRKEKLSINEQIEYMKKAGITFSIISEEDAHKFLHDSSYFLKLKLLIRTIKKM